MSHSQLLQATVRHAGATAILDLEGEINGAADAPVQEAWGQALALSPRRVLLNLTGVEYINSTGIAVLVSLLAQAQRSGLPLVVCGLSDHYAEIFRITRLTDFMPAYATEAEALAPP